MKRLVGRVAVVTGGAGGIGAATANRLISEGAKVVIADIDSKRALTTAEQFGSECLGLKFDASDTESIKKMLEKTVSHFGRLDILHNNVAITTPEIQQLDTTVTEITFDTWDTVFDINLKSYLAACKYAIPYMLNTGGGSIINTASGAGLAGDVSRTAYGATKAGIISLTKYVAVQYGRQGIRCNSISPGLILTEALQQAVPELIEIIRKHVLTPELGKPEDVAALVAFLASDDAAYINGENICCDGGHLAHQPQVADVIRLMSGR